MTLTARHAPHQAVHKITPITYMYPCTKIPTYYTSSVLSADQVFRHQASRPARVDKVQTRSLWEWEKPTTKTNN